MASKKRSMVSPSEAEPIDIDALIGAKNGSAIEIDSPIRDGVKIKLELLEFSGDDIMDKTVVYDVNQRNQRWLTETSLGPLINAFKLSRGQTVPAIGILNDDGTVTVVAGSRRRKAAYLSGYPYRILASKNLLPEEASIITEVENVNSPISLIENGERWSKIQDQFSLSYREIAKEIKDGGVSHTYIAIGINGYKLPDEIKALYPSLNCINRKTIPKLKKALEYKGADEICDHINNAHSDILKLCAESYAMHSDTNCDKLTNIIEAFCFPKPQKKVPEWHSSVTLTETSKNEIEGIKFNTPLSKDKVEKLKVFLASLLK